MNPRALLTLSVLPEFYVICKLGPQEVAPDWAAAGDFYSITRTRDELSIVCREKNVPAGVSAAPGWRALKLEGPLDFALTGIIAAVAEPLADAGVAIFPIATYDTDYVLIKHAQLDLAVHALTACGHVIRI